MVNIKPIHHFILICLYTISNSVIEVPMTIIPQKLPTIPITLGADQTFNVVVDTGSQHFWVADEASNLYVTKKYNKASPTYTESDKTFIANYTTGEQVRGHLGEETFSIPSTSLTSDNPIKMNFGLAMSGSLMLDNIDGFLGFGRNYNSHSELNDKSDLLLQLKNNNLISQKIFSLKYYNNPSTNQLEGTLYLGDWNKSVIVPSNSSNTCECNVIQSHTHDWACKVSHIIIGDPVSFRTTAVPIDKDAFFNTGSSTNILPIEYLEIFKKKLDKAKCRNETMEGYEYLYCENITAIPSMYFVFGEYGLNINKDNFFSKVNDTKEEFLFRFVFSYQHDHIVFGVTLLKDYQLYFDEERSVVGFYNDDQSKIRHLVTYMKPHWFAYILVVILVILEGVMVLWFVVWCKKSKTLNTTADSTLISAESLGDIGGKLD